MRRTTGTAERQPPAEMFSRSPDSLAFEEFWRSLRGVHRMPRRRDFNPARAAHFIRDLVLMEAPGPSRACLRIRLAGERYQELAGHTLAGSDHLDSLAPEYHAGALATGRMMSMLPCGLWQISPMHLPCGYGQFVEITGFPLGAGDDNIPLLICYVRLTGELLGNDHAPLAGLELDTAAAFHFIDVGFGTPNWSSP